MTEVFVVASLRGVAKRRLLQNIYISMGLALLAFTSLGYAAYGILEDDFDSPHQVLGPAIGVPIGAVTLTAASVFAAEAIDAHLLGDPDHRLAMGISGISLIVLSPVMLVPIAFLADSDIFFVYLVGPMPSLMVTGIGLTAWGFLRRGESKHQEKLENLKNFVIAPSAIVDPKGEITPTLNLSVRW